MTRTVRPMMGTFVEIAVDGVEQPVADEALRTALRSLERADSLWSSHRPDSDVAELNRSAARGEVAVHPLTHRLLALATAISRDSAGAFDVTTGAELVRRGAVPRPASAIEPARDATWRDVELLDGHRVRFVRPLWIDLGGIAKGFAVDCAIEACALPADATLCINAGGDLRWVGAGERTFLLDAAPATPTADAVPAGESRAPPAAVAMTAGALASSDFRPSPRARRTRSSGELAVRDGRGLDLAPAFVSVAAPSCAVADALTKVVQIAGRRATGLLASHGARAYCLASAGWMTLPPGGAIGPQAPAPRAGAS